jgi:serine/threonine protein kinase
MKRGFKVGPYEIGRELGKGATGTVYEGIDHLNELTVAIKVIKHSQSSKRLLLHEIDVSLIFLCSMISSKRLYYLHHILNIWKMLIASYRS